MYSVITADLLAGSFTISAFMCLMLISGPGLAYSCCLDKAPISDCSFSYNQETVMCEIRGTPKLLVMDTCHNGYTDPTDIPWAVTNLRYDFYNTTCSPTIHPTRPLTASLCHTQCNNDSATVYVGLNITFQVEVGSSGDLEAISVSLRSGTDTGLRCIEFNFGGNRLSQNAATHHHFFYDGFIGLIPGGYYTINVLTIPSDSGRHNVKTETIPIPRHFKSCWNPDLVFHDTPFAVNITLFEDIIYNFKRFDVTLIGLETKEVILNTTELYEIDGKWGTNVTFECLQPTSEEQNLFIQPKDCPYCTQYNTGIQIRGAPPSFMDCPRDDVIHEVQQGRYFEGDTVRGINWTVPVPSFQSNCQSSTDSTHTPVESTFVVGRITTVSYYARQCGTMAECTFYVHVKLVADTSASLPLVIGASCAAGTFFIIIMAISLYFVYTKRRRGINRSDTNEPVPIYTKEEFCPISSREEQGVPLGLLSDYPGSQLSLNSSKIHGSQALKHPEMWSLECYRSLPTTDHPSSGYSSAIKTNSDQHRYIEEENSTLLCRDNMYRRNSEEGYSDGQPDDEPGPMSMEYIS